MTDLYEFDHATGRAYPVLENDEDPDLESLERACFPEEFEPLTAWELDQFDDSL